MGKRLICLLLCLCLLLPAVGCGYQKDGELVCPLPGAVSSLDPQTASGTAARLVIGSLFEGLCRLDENGEAVPGVAERWECDSTQTEYTFHLRKNARWSDGTPVTADDFRFAIERCLNPDTASPNADDLFLIQGGQGHLQRGGGPVLPGGGGRRRQDPGHPAGAGLLRLSRHDGGPPLHALQPVLFPREPGPLRPFLPVPAHQRALCPGQHLRLADRPRGTGDHPGAL